MTLTRSDIAKSVRERVLFKKKKRDRQQFLFPELNFDMLSKKRAKELVDATFELMKKKLENGEPILVSGFGKFQVKFKWARKGRNPKTGEQIIIKSHRVVSFHCSPKLKEKINRQ
jgi:integration host factor subunit alpha